MTGPGQMRAIVFDGPDRPLRAETRALPEPAEGRLLLKVKTCGVCRTDLHLLDGEVAVKRPPRILCHQIVATVIGAGPSTELEGIATGQRVGVPWLGWTCGQCEWCRSGRENLCPHARFTGCDIDGGMAEYTVADARYCFAIPENYPDDQAAPLLCAGLIGWRSLRMCGEAQRLGLYGFGAAAHHRPGRRLAGAQRVRPDKTWRHRGSRVRPQARGGLGGRLGRTAA